MGFRAGQNLNLYVGGNPVNYFDPQGLLWDIPKPVHQFFCAFAFCVGGNPLTPDEPPPDFTLPGYNQPYGEQSPKPETPEAPEELSCPAPYKLSPGGLVGSPPETSPINTTPVIAEEPTIEVPPIWEDGCPICIVIWVITTPNNAY
jgi:hypothetical protein